MPKKGEHENLTGQKFNHLTAIQYAGQKGRRKTYWLCKCDCGNTTTVETTHLKNGHTTSCGCRLKQTRQNIKYVNYKNGESNSKLYYVFRDMINRCYNKKVSSYKYYGKKGVTICDEWNNKEIGFVNFYNWSMANGYKDGLSIDRIDNEKGYSPDNCRWATITEQANNKSNNRRVIYNNKLYTIGELSSKYNIDYFLLRYRINHGWDIEKALTTKPCLGRNQFSK